MDANVKPLIDHTKDTMDKAVMLEGIKAHVYGTDMPLNQVASISAPEPRLLVLQPFDKSAVPAIEKSIRDANLGLNPINDGGLIRVPIPQLTEERRKQLVKQAKDEGEKAKVAIRNVRRDHNEKLKKMKADGVSEDLIKNAEAEIQKLTDSHITKVDDILKKKEAEVMTV
jgi:ribosome recycling factor